MKAEDTVLKSRLNPDNSVHFPTQEEQAEVSFKAGLREVVEWIKQNRTTPLGDDPYGYYIWETKLQAQLKEWGL